MKRAASWLGRVASLLLGAAFALLIALFSLSDLISVTGGRAAMIAETFAVSYAACAAIAAALVLILLAGQRLQRRLGAPPSPKEPASRGRWPGAALATGWVAFVTSPFLAPSVVAGEWMEAAKLVLMVGGLILGFLVVVMLWAILAEARRRV